MSVRSKPLKDGEPVEERPARPDPVYPGRRPVAGGVALGVACIAFGLPLWIPGARYTVDGSRIGVNMLLAWLGLPIALPQPPWQAYVLLVLSLGLLFSVVEVRTDPRRLSLRSLGPRGAIAVLAGLALVHGWDLGSTYLGVTNPPADAWPIMRAIAASPFWSTVVTFVVTYLPETLIVTGWRLAFAR